MVLRTRELEAALGGGIKRVEANEEATSVVQRRSIRARGDIQAGARLALSDFEYLRPCPKGGLAPFEISKVLGKKLSRNISRGEHLTWQHIE
jgi:sialic acid synthase SpsE